MRQFAETAERIRATTKKKEKVALLAEYFRRASLEVAAQSAIFFCGRPFAAAEEKTLQVGAALLWRLSAEIAGVLESELAETYRKFGDLGDAFAAAVSASARPGVGSRSSLSVPEVAVAFARLAEARGPAAKTQILRALLAYAAPLEAKYIIKIMLGDLRIGLRESLVEEAIAQAFGRELAQVQRANMMLGDIAATLPLAAEDRLSEARMKLFHPIGFMLATAVPSAEEAFACFAGPEAPVKAHEGQEHSPTAKRFQIEDKYDGIRAQAHVGKHSGARVARIFSRTLDEVTGSFPELVSALTALPGELVLDGEIVAWDRAAGRALPFTVVQQRLGRKRVSLDLQKQAPIAYVAFDVLYQDGELMIDRALRERGARLDSIFAATREHVEIATEDPQGELAMEPAIERATAELVRAPAVSATSAEELSRLFDAAQARGNEGLMLKNLDSAYTPGRRGGAWLKLKRELATLDVVVTAVEYGHGKRAGVLSDYTFAVRDDREPSRLLNVGKAYSGLTDAEIAQMTEFFLAHTLRDEGFRRMVEPLVVLEVAFNNVMISDRHESGFALRFPRIARLRPDKPASEIDTLGTVRKIYERQ